MEVAEEIKNLPALDNRKLKAIIMIVDGETKTNVAKELGVGRTTLFLWEQDPAYQQVLEHYQTEIRALLLDPMPKALMEARLKENLPKAAQTLLDIMINGKNEHARLKAVEMLMANFKDEFLEVQSEFNKGAKDFLAEHNIVVDGELVGSEPV